MHILLNSCFLTCVILLSVRVHSEIKKKKDYGFCLISHNLSYLIWGQKKKKINPQKQNLDLFICGVCYRDKLI